MKDLRKGRVYFILSKSILYEQNLVVWFKKKSVDGLPWKEKFKEGKGCGGKVWVGRND